MTDITITLPDGATRDYPRGVTGRRGGGGHLEIAGEIGAGLPDRRDAQRPVAPDRARSRLAIVTGKDEAAALELIRHDCAHIMARAVQELFQGHQGHHRPGDRERLVL